MPRPGQQSRVRLRALLELRGALIRSLLRAGGVLALLLTPAAAWSWGGRTHEIINRQAARLAPGAAGAVWAPLAISLGNHASDADHRKSFRPGEPERHYLDVDVYGDPPFDDVPRSFDELARRHGREAASRWGRLPWAVDECYRMLVLSLRRGDWGSAGAWAADLGHYVADVHQPLHGTLNYDGQSTGNDGIHLRFEVHMMNRYFREEWITGPTGGLDSPVDPVELCFAWLAGAYPHTETILHADDLARARDASFGEPYYEALWEGTREVAIAQVTRAVHHLAALYAAAWDEGGRPPSPPEEPPFRALSPEELDPPPPPRGTPRGALILAGLAILGAFVLEAL